MIQRWLAATGVAALAALLLAGPAAALTITLSDMSSDATPASTLNATLEISVIGGNTLQIVANNDTTAPDEFNISEIFWNASSDVSALTLTSATHSVSGDVFAAWNPVDVNTMVDGFGVFDFGLTDGVGEANPNIIMPGHSITFVMSISGACAGTNSCTTADFFEANGMGKVAAAKFVNGPDDPENPGNEDSAYGAANVPEPGTALLLVLGLLGLARLGRR